MHFATVCSQCHVDFSASRGPSSIPDQTALSHAYGPVRYVLSYRAMKSFRFCIRARGQNRLEVCLFRQAVDAAIPRATPCAMGA